MKKMKVKLLNSYENEYIGQLGAAICIDRLNKPTEQGMQNALKSGHLSIIEHLPLTFSIENISRSCSHQLVRH